MNTSPESNLVPLLKKRASLLKAARSFFDSKNFTEVDCPALRAAPPLDDHIEIFEILLSDSKIAYLHSSPEYGMKELLSYGLGDIYQISHVFRKEHPSLMHSVEFTMAEWYRVGMNYDAFIQETLEFIQIFLPNTTPKFLGYKEAFDFFAGIKSFEKESLIARILQEDTGISHAILESDVDTLLQWILGFIIEPKLKGSYLWVIQDFPASQAALAQTTLKNGELTALRFEIYYEGIELANGYKELIDLGIQEKRFAKANKKRLELGKKAYPLDERLLKALKRGLPDCCGVAAGFDRLVMLSLNKKSIHEVMPPTL